MGVVTCLLAAGSWIYSAGLQASVGTPGPSHPEASSRPAGPSPASEARANPRCSAAQFSASLSALSSPSVPGWVASDGFASAEVSPGVSVFFTGDTVYGTSQAGTPGPDAHFVRNTMMVHRSNSSTCWQSFTGGNDSGFIPPQKPGPASDTWVWPGTPLVHGNIVAVPSAEMVHTNGVMGGFGFAMTAMTLHTYLWDGATLVPRSVRTIAAAQANPDPARASAIAWTSPMIVGNVVYLYGTSLRTGAGGHDLFLAQTSVDEFFSDTPADLGPQLRFWTGATWAAGASYDELAPVVSGQCDSVVSAVPGAAGVHLLTKRYSMMGSTIADVHGPSPHGPFTVTDVATVPARPGLFSYGVYAHPQFPARAGHVWLSVDYNAANMSFADMRHYRPVMLDVALSS